MNSVVESERISGQCSRRMSGCLKRAFICTHAVDSISSSGHSYRFVSLTLFVVEVKCKYKFYRLKFFFFLWRCDPTRVMASSFLRFSRSHTTTHHSRYDSSGLVISSSQRPLPDNTQHLQQTNIHAPVGFEPTITTGDRPQSYPLDREATGTGGWIVLPICNFYCEEISFQALFYFVIPSSIRICSW